ncbi:MAG: hypothetical protein AB7I09_20495 [Planctomycetota bacterium]
MAGVLGVPSSFYNELLGVIRSEIGADAAADKVEFAGLSRFQLSIVERSRAAVLGRCTRHSFRTKAGTRAGKLSLGSGCPLVRRRSASMRTALPR